MVDQRTDRHGRALYGLVMDEKARWKELTPEQRANWSAMADMFIETIVPAGSTVVDAERLKRLVAAADKLRRYARSIVGYGGHVPAAEALLDSDLVLEP